MTEPAAPGPARTSSGSPLPLVALPQTALLTVNESEVPLVKDTLGPGIHVKTPAHSGKVEGASPRGWPAQGRP